VPFGVERDPTMYMRLTRKSVAASSFVWFPPYFHFRFHRKWLSDRVIEAKANQMAHINLWTNLELFERYVFSIDIGTCTR